MHFGANVFVLDGVDLFPAFCIAVQGEGKQTLDDALLGGSEITAFYPGVVAAMTTKEAVNDEKQQAGIKGEQRGATQWLERHHVEIAGNRQVAFELGILEDADGAHGDVSVAPHEAEETVAQASGKALVDELQRLHAVPHDAIG